MEYDLAENESISPLFYLYNNQLHLWKNNEVIHLVEKFLPEGKMTVSEEEWPATLHKFLLPLAKENKVDFDKSLGTGNKRRRPRSEVISDRKRRLSDFPAFIFL